MVFRGRREERRERAREKRRRGDANDRAGPGDSHAGSEHEPENIAAGCAERHADTEFAPPLAHPERQHAVGIDFTFDFAINKQFLLKLDGAFDFNVARENVFARMFSHIFFWIDC